MATAVAQNIPPPPPGFTLDQSPGADGGVPPPPPGFTLDSAAPAAPPQQEAPQSPSLFDRYKNSVFGKIGPLSVLEPAAQLGTSLFSTPIAGLAGLGTMATNAVGLTDAQPGNVTNAVSGALTYEPKTPGGQMGASVVNYPLEKLAQLGDTVGEGIRGQPFTPRMVQDANGGWREERAPANYKPGAEGLVNATAAGANTAIQALPALLMKGRGGKPPAKAAAVAETAPKVAPKALSPREAAAQAAKDEGLSLTPMQAGGKVGKLAESLTGQAKLERSISLKNAPRVNEMAATEIGLPEGTKTITKADLSRLKVEANKPYNELAKTGTRKTSAEFKQEIEAIGDRSGGKSFEGDTPAQITNMKKFYGNIRQFSAEDAVNKIRKLRRDGNANKGGKYDPEKAALGDVQLKIADALDNELARHAESLGKPELAANYKAARVQLAKLATVENALRGSDVSALALARALKNGAPLSGKLKTIATSAAEFEKSFQEVRKIRDAGALGVADYLLGVGGATASPALAAAVLARPAVRAVLSSDAYQRRAIGPRQGNKAPATPGVSKNALATATVANEQRAAR